MLELLESLCCDGAICRRTVHTSCPIGGLLGTGWGTSSYLGESVSLLKWDFYRWRFVFNWETSLEEGRGIFLFGWNVSLRKLDFIYCRFVLYWETSLKGGWDFFFSGDVLAFENETSPRVGLSFTETLLLTEGEDETSSPSSGKLLLSFTKTFLKR